MSQTVLVVDDEQKLVDLVRAIMEKEGYNVVEAHNGYQAVEKVRESLPDAVLLDVMMPEMDGFEALKEIRQASNVPVIMLTVQATENDKVRGLELGADDYVAKPFDHRELASRVKAVLRRAALPSSVSRSEGELKIDDYLQIDFDKREVIANGKRQKLRPTEYKLLYHLVSNAGKLMSHEQLLTKVWGREYRDDEQLLRLYITYLRQKIEADPSHPKYILNERGLGYRFVDYRTPQS
ncbi:MAG: response regulator transcription factor [Chloroflexi bacterium]|nr:response regulator transcription factor [Chloroflexota bacterium]OJV89147.1 MAG: DNA-binding response regulator [Chloroflexi bacterium 54-19]